MCGRARLVGRVDHEDRYRPVRFGARAFRCGGLSNGWSLRCRGVSSVEVTGADLASGVGKERAAESYGLIKHKYAKPTSSPSDETHCVAYIIGSAGAASAPIMTLS